MVQMPWTVTLVPEALRSTWLCCPSVVAAKMTCDLNVVIFFVCLAQIVLSLNDPDELRDIFSLAFVNLSSTLGKLATSVNQTQNVTVSPGALNSSCLNSTGDLRRCLQFNAQCLSLQDVGALYSLDSNQILSQDNISVMSSALLYSLVSCGHHQKFDMKNSSSHPLPDVAKHVTPSTEASWGYSMLFVTLINLCSLTGALILPCMKLAKYKLLLMFMVALAVGTLAGSGLLFLIPENTNFKKKCDELATQDAVTTSFRRIPIDNSIPEKDFSNIPENIGGMCNSQPDSNSSSYSICSEAAIPEVHDNEGHHLHGDNNKTSADEGCGDAPYTISIACEKHVGNGHSHHHRGHHQHQGEVAPVAYMIIFGDALHNFIDGLSIGSAFTQSIMTGIGVSVAVFCEELPHELGDFAVLLNSGMRFRRAILYNFLSACTCYIGVIIGILLGENTMSHEWIFAVAGGMFLYISLVDMMPEMNTAAESPEGKQFGEFNTFILQNFGILTGYGIMLVMALYSGNISFGS
ncbi:hypothetical protein Btru_006301 [Bulinus truncatus]|nr:hypothetical protein Btru_006301 [Bulinus truncatus]